MYDTTLSVSCCGTTHQIVTDGGLTATDYVRNFVALAKSRGYILTSILDAMQTITQEVQEEVDVVTE